MIIPSLISVGIKCHYCSKFRARGEVISWPGGVKICRACYERHRKLLETATMADCCGECKTTFEQMAEIGLGNIPMYIHFKDGVYQMLCPQCSDAYEQKRSDLYGSTEYGAMKGIGR